jgi:hypothetical protein
MFSDTWNTPKKSMPTITTTPLTEIGKSTTKSVKFLQENGITTVQHLAGLSSDEYEDMVKLCGNNQLRKAVYVLRLTALHNLRDHPQDDDSTDTSVDELSDVAAAVDECTDFSSLFIKELLKRTNTYPETVKSDIRELLESFNVKLAKSNKDFS